ncbi:MAG: hypothetical protein AB7S97_04385 [Thermoplasmata archaeon]
MAKVNTIGLTGAALSLVAAFTFWLYALLSGSVITSGSDSFTLDMRYIMTVLAVIYMTGALLGVLSQLGGVLQVPSVVIGLPLAWYLGYHLALYMLYLVGFFGTSMLVMAIFLERSRGDRGFKAPPFSRARIWTKNVDAAWAKPFSKGAARMMLVIVVMCPVIAAAFATYSWESDVSAMRISVSVNGLEYGSTNVSIIVDGEVVLTSYLEYNPGSDRDLYVITTCEVPAGTHTIEVDAWNGAQLTEGTVDIRVTERVLPFTSERTRLMIGYGSV